MPEYHWKPIKSISFMFSVPFIRFHSVILPVILVLVLVKTVARWKTPSLVMLGSGSAAADSNPLYYPTIYSCRYS